MVRVVVLLVMMAHGGLTLQSWTAFGYKGFLPPFADANTTQIFSDLVISLSLLHCAIALHIRQRGGTALRSLPFLIGTVLSGAFSPLINFLWRPGFLERVLQRPRNSVMHLD